MAENISIKNTSTSGFYYDIQMANPLLTATLHTNTYISKIGTTTYGPDADILDPYENEGPFEWTLWPRSIGCLDPLTHTYSLAYDENPSACYNKKPLVTAILSEDFQIEMGNNWGDAGGATEIESFFNQLKSNAPYTKEIGAGMEKLAGKILEYTGEESILGKGVNLVKKSAKSMKESGADTLNSALITQGTRFSYYGGTSTTFSNLNMRFTLFADWVYDENRKKWLFKTVHDQLRKIYPYAVGKYHQLDLNVKDHVDNKELGEKIDNTISSFFGWQQPPAGFQSDIRSLDTCQKGTLRLVLGGYYTAENLIISGMSVNFSKVMTKIPPRAEGYVTNVNSVTQADYDNTYEWEEDVVDKNGKVTGTKKNYKANTYNGKKASSSQEVGEFGGGELTPLYADVTITLRPASSYSDKSIINFSSNLGKGRFNFDMTMMRNRELFKAKEEKKASG